jgi:hypothetical protein
MRIVHRSLVYRLSDKGRRNPMIIERMKQFDEVVATQLTAPLDGRDEVFAPEECETPEFEYYGED